jgi:hypothetical protein
MKRRKLAWPEWASTVREADLLLFRGWRLNPLHLLIMGLTRSPYVHAAMVAFHHGHSCGYGVFVPTVLEMLQFRGGRETELFDQVRRWPGRWDLYRTNPHRLRPEFCRVEAVRWMRELIGRRYGYWSLLRVGWRHLPIVRLLVRPETDDQMLDRRSAPFCSQAVAWACRVGGVDPVPNRPDRLTEPGDLAQSIFFEYLGTLTDE